MSAGTALASLPHYAEIVEVDTDDPFLIDVVVPIESETMDAAVAAAGIAPLLSGAPAELDTFLEAFNRFVQDESAASALTAVVATKAASARTIAAQGLASGGGDLSADRTISVPKATAAQAQAATDDTVALTPASALLLIKAQPKAVLTAIRGALPTSKDGLGVGDAWLNDGTLTFVTSL